MGSIKIKVSRGGYASAGFGTTVGNPDEIEIDVPLPDRILTGEHIQITEAVFGATADLVDAVRGQEDVVDAEVDDAEVSA